MNDSLSYILAASLQELFPQSEIEKIAATPKCFFCDVQFPGKFDSSLLSLLEERMREWVKRKISLNVLTMIPSNAAQMLEHHGHKKLAQKVRKEEGEIVLLQL